MTLGDPDFGKTTSGQALARHAGAARDRWVDPYAWLRDPGYPKVEDPAIRAYLEAENAYFEAVMAPKKDLVEHCTPSSRGGSRTTTARCRSQTATGSITGPSRPAPSTAPGTGPPGPAASPWSSSTSRPWPRAELLQPRQPGGQPRCAAPGLRHRQRRLRALRHPDQGSGVGRGRRRGDPNTSGGVVWAADSSTFFYVELNDNLRPYRVRLHRLGNSPRTTRSSTRRTTRPSSSASAETQSRRFVIVGAGSHVTREIRLIEAAVPSAADAGGRAARRSSLQRRARGRPLVDPHQRHPRELPPGLGPVESPGEANWQEEIAGSDDDYLIDVTCFADFMVVTERRHGLANLRVRRYDGSEHAIDFQEAVYTAGLGDNREFGPTGSGSASRR
jgi:oligopeptidase B